MSTQSTAYGRSKTYELEAGQLPLESFASKCVAISQSLRIYEPNWRLSSELSKRERRDYVIRHRYHTFRMHTLYIHRKRMRMEIIKLKMTSRHVPSHLEHELEKIQVEIDQRLQGSSIKNTKALTNDCLGVVGSSPP